MNYTRITVLIAAWILMAAQSSAVQDRPNMLWITTEDNSPALGCYGDKRAETPNLDELAERGVRYDMAFANNPVCSPARFTLFFGSTAQRMGTTQMRSGMSIPDNFYSYAYYARESGYFTSNHFKTDYNFAGAYDPKKMPRLGWDVCGHQADYRNRPKGQPFFAVINLHECHESAQALIGKKYQPSKREKASVKLAPYQLDNEETRREWAIFYQSMKVADERVGKILKQLEDDGDADNTIIFYYGDHGGTLPRSKRFLYETGTRVPFIVYFPKKWQHLAPGRPGSHTDRLVSFVDFGPTALNLLGIPVPEHMEGKPFLGENAAPEAQYVYLARDRMDTYYDMMRGVRGKRFRYIRNYTPQKLLWQRLEYPEELFPSLKQHREAFLAGKCNAAQATLWKPKAVEELYDVESDPWEVNNLANDPKYRKELARLRAVNAKRVREIIDPGFIPEGELESRFRQEGGSAFALARQPGFPYERIVETAEMASLGNKENLPKLVGLMEDPEPSIRFWAAMGCAVLGENATPASAELQKLLNDDSIDVRCAAAEALIRQGNVEAGVPVLLEVTREVRLSAHVQRAISTLVDLDTANPGLLKPFVSDLDPIRPKYWRMWKPLNTLRASYGLPSLDWKSVQKTHN